MTSLRLILDDTVKDKAAQTRQPNNEGFIVLISSFDRIALRPLGRNFKFIRAPIYVLTVLFRDALQVKVLGVGLTREALNRQMRGMRLIEDG